MAKKADIGGKRLISLDPEAWAQWVTSVSGLRTLDVLSSEFQWISRESDVLIKVSSPGLGEFLILNELQLHYSSKMPKRMTAYAALAREKYDLPVYPVLINILPPNQDPEIPAFFESNFLGLQARQDYQVINLWEVEAEQVFTQPLPALLPFVPVLKGGGNEDVLRRAVQELRQNPQLAEFEPLLAFFARFVLELPLIQEIMRWDMAVLRESPWYEQSRQEGRQEGLIEVARNMLRKGMSV
jgi:predicted transposase YdaD